MKKVVVNKNACIGCGACVSIAPETFEFDDNGLSEVIKAEDIENENVISAIEACPTSAISIQDDNDNNTENDDTSKCQCGDSCECEDCDCNKDKKGTVE